MKVKLDAERTSDGFWIPLGDDVKVFFSRMTWAKQAMWSVHTVYEKFKKIGNVKAMTFMESEDSAIAFQMSVEQAKLKKKPEDKLKALEMYLKKFYEEQKKAQE